MDGEITQVEDDDSQGPKVIIPVQIVDDDYQSFNNIENTSQHVRTKYYKQTYRPAWEQMPDFVGWLKGVEKEPTRAFCIYCQKTLHAHRLSLLKHTCTIRHQKAAQLHQMRKQKSMKSVHGHESHVLTEDLSANPDELGHEEDDEVAEFSENQQELEDNEVDNLTELDNEQLEDEEGEDDAEEVELAKVNFNEPYTKNDSIPPISTQVTDAVRGLPVSGLQVSLYKLIEGRWTYINEGFTNVNGKFSKFLDGVNFTPGRYKLHYDVDRYFESKKQESLYPFIEIVFDLRGQLSNYHIPLILSPNGYTTYKGSCFD